MRHPPRRAKAARSVDTPLFSARHIMCYLIRSADGSPHILRKVPDLVTLVVRPNPAGLIPLNNLPRGAIMHDLLMPLRINLVRLPDSRLSGTDGVPSVEQSDVV